MICLYSSSDVENWLEHPLLRFIQITQYMVAPKQASNPKEKRLDPYPQCIDPRTNYPEPDFHMFPARAQNVPYM
jgi:hypothetical protein